MGTNFKMAPARLLLLPLLAVALVSVAGRARAFEADKVYKYQLEGAIASKVADEDRPQYAGWALSARLLARRSGADELTVRLRDLQSATFNQLIEEPHSHKSFNYTPMGALAAGLDRPFRVLLDAETGAVRGLESEREEPRWVSNFKRGLASAFFQLKLSPAAAASGEQQVELSNSRNQYYTTSERSVFGECDTDYLLLMEPAQLGEQQQAAEQRRYYMNVTKARNMARCKGRPVHRFLGVDASECADNEKELRQYKHSSSVAHFELLGTRQNFVIQQARVEELASFAPFGRRAHSHSIESKFALKLIEQLPGAQATAAAAAELLGEPGALKQLDSLSYEPAEAQNFYAELNLEQEHHLSAIYQSSASVEETMQAFEALVSEQRNHSQALERELPALLESSRLAELFLRLNELVGTLSAQKIEQLYAQLDQRGEAHKRLFWNLISVVGTNPSLVFMKRLIMDGDAPAVRIRDFLARLSYHLKQPSKSLFDEYLQLCRSDKIQAEQQYKRLCSLPLASLIHQHCVKPHAKYLRAQHEQASGAPPAPAPAAAHKRAPSTSCQLATAEDYFARLVTPATGSGSASSASEPADSAAPAPSSLGDRMLNIKLAGELGVRASVAYLAEVLAERREHPSLRAAAAWQLHKAARVYPGQVRRLVAPLYHERGELLEVRLAALHAWLAAGMPLHEMEALAGRLQAEPSRQLVVYVHSLFASLAKLEPGLPCANWNERNARLVLPVIERALRRHSAPGLTDSQASIQASWQPDYGYASSSLVSIIYANDSLAPTSLFYSSSELMSGLKLSPLSVSVQAHGLERLYKRALGVAGLLADKQSFMDVFSLKRRAKRRSRRQTPAAHSDDNDDELASVRREALAVDRELGAEARADGELYLAVSVSAYGRPLGFFDRDGRELRKLISDDGTIRIPAIKKLMHAYDNHTSQQMLINFEKLELFNNELGLPLFQSVQDFDYKSFKLNSVKLDAEPAFFRDERQGRPLSKLALAVDARVARHSEMLVQSGALVAPARQLAGAALHKKRIVNAPLRLALELNLATSQASVRLQPLAEGLVYALQAPLTFARSHGAERADSWLPLHALNDSNQMRPFKLELAGPLGLGLRLEGKHRAGHDWSLAAWRRYLGQVSPSAAKFLFDYSPTGRPLEARLSSVPALGQEPVRELVALLSWRHHQQPQQQQQQQPPPRAEQLSEAERELELTTGRQGARNSSEQLEPTTVSYKLELQAGASEQRRLSLELSYSRSFDRLLHSWRAFYSAPPQQQQQQQQQQPAGAPEALPSNLCWLGQMQFPEHDADKLLKLQLDQLDHSANLTSELTFGPHCSSAAPAAPANASVSARVRFEWSREQRQAIEWALRGAEPAGAATPEQGALEGVYARLLRDCLAARSSDLGAKLAPSCLQLLRKTAELTHITAHFDYRNLSQRWIRLARRLASLYTYARAGYIEQLDEQAQRSSADLERYSSPDGSHERAHLEANLSALEVANNERQLSYDLDTLSYHASYRSVPVSVAPLSTLPLLGASFYQQLQRRAGFTSCLVSGNQVSTFDNYTYSLSAESTQESCLKLVAKDCSTEQNYLVLAARSGQAAKLVRVYLGQRFKVEFVADKQLARVAELRLNGRPVGPVQPGGRPVRRYVQLGANSVEALAIESNGAYYTLSSKLYKLSVSTDGTFVHVQQARYYAGKSCGLCGDANGEQLYELRSPRGRVCASTLDFVWSNALASTCPSRPASVECA